MLRLPFNTVIPFNAVIPAALKPVVSAKAGIHIILLAAALLPALTLACGSGPPPTATPAPAATPAPVMPTATQPPVEGHQPTPPPAAPTSASAAASPPGGAYAPSREGDELNVILATTVLEPGPQRVAFLLTTQTGLVKDSNVVITPVYVPDNAALDPIVTRFNEWPYGTRGTFAAEVDFDRPGRWRLDIAADGPDATGWAVQEFEVTESSPVPALGAAGPLSENKTLSAFGDLALITTDYSPDPALYRVTVRDAVESRLPAVVVFASPAFCTTATCGPQVDTVSELRAAYDGQAHFIHVEIYDNPDEIQGDLDRARIAATVDEWGLTQLPHWFNESWTFVLDAEGRVRARFEGLRHLHRTGRVVAGSPELTAAGAETIDAQCRKSPNPQWRRLNRDLFDFGIYRIGGVPGMLT